ncbi:hypothetical protein ACHHYP_15926 [Achlya hypogyna]|uniref:Transmembrane protein n=1 Tax=Achlya hypogyna TaxID=1202772 RepID=A0A1V9Y9X3_ACHHY|nr:hypothetical protein ACHHYP_15926 [Achlya hypogyna]
MSSRTLRAMQSLGRQSSLAELHEEAKDTGGLTGYITSSATSFFTSPHGVCIKLSVFVAFVALTLPFIFVPICISWKIEGELKATWVATLTPLWITTAIFILVTMFLTQVEDLKKSEASTTNTADSTDCHTTNASVQLEPTESSPTKKIATWSSVLSVLCSLAAYVLIALRLDGHIDWSWTHVLLPYCAANIVNMSTQSILQALQVVFIGLKLDSSIDWTWVTVLLPTWLPIFFMMFIAPLGLTVILLLMQTDEGESRPWCTSLSLGAGLFLFVGLLGGPQLLIVLRLQYFIFSTMWICLPWIVLYAIVVFIGGCGIVFVAFKGDSDAVTTDETTSLVPKTNDSV